MKKIGILLESENISELLNNSIEDISKIKNCEIVLIKFINNQSKINRVLNSFLKNPFHTFSKLIFKLIVKIEYYIINPRLKTNIYNKKRVCKDYTSCYITAIRYGVNFVKFSKDDISKLNNLNFHIIIRGNTTGILKGDILNCSEKGIISFHHGDNNWNRGRPPAFWEVYLRKKSTGFIIQKLNNELDGGIIYIKGCFSTKRTYLENLTYLLNESNAYLVKVVIDLIENKENLKQTIPYAGKLYRTPNIIVSLNYAKQLFSYILITYIKRKVCKIYPRWNVAYKKIGWDNSNLLKFKKIKNQKNHFFADPFIVEFKGKIAIFVEDYNYIKSKGSISVIEIKDDGYHIKNDVIDESFHLSFPYIFEYKHELYMVPESSSNSDIRLYKCIEFPNKWKYMHNLMSNINAVDSMIFEFDNKWVMMANISTTKKFNNYCSALHLFYSDSPTSKNWINHENNPIYIDSKISRNGGLLKNKFNQIFRVRQSQGFHRYGESISIAEIKSVKDIYCEKSIGSILNTNNKIIGMHHMHSSENYTVYDYCVEEKINL